MVTQTALRRPAGRVSEEKAGPSAWLAEVLWRVSENLRPLLRGFSPTFGVVEPKTEHLSIREKSAMDGFRMGL